MTIVIITGPSKSGKSLIANALRNSQVSNKPGEYNRGVLLVDENTALASEKNPKGAEPKVLLEKLLSGANYAPLAEGQKVKDLPWKPDPLVIVVGKMAGILDEFEKLLPGFREHFGPVHEVATKTAAK